MKNVSVAVKTICSNSWVTYSIKKNPQRIKRIRPFIDQYDWKRINLPANQKTRKRFKEKTKQLSLMFSLHNAILKKQDRGTFQNTSQTVNIK